MGWAARHIESLKAGKTVQFRPHGNSMVPHIKSGQLCTVKPVSEEDPVSGSIVLCKVNGREFLHLIKAVRRHGETLSFQIGNAKGHVNGWVGRSSIFGVLVTVDP